MANTSPIISSTSSTPIAPCTVTRRPSNWVCTSSGSASVPPIGPIRPPFDRPIRIHAMINAKVKSIDCMPCGGEAADYRRKSRYQIERPAGDAMREFGLRPAGDIDQHQPDAPQVEAALVVIEKGNRLSERLNRA